MDLHKQQSPESLVRATNAPAVMRSRNLCRISLRREMAPRLPGRVEHEKTSLDSRSGLDGLVTFLLGVIGRFCHNGKS
jgi:hypothetical protein